MGGIKIVLDQLLPNIPDVKTGTQKKVCFGKHTNQRAMLTYKCTYEDQIPPIFVLTRELKEILGTMNLGYIANGSIDSSSSSDEEDNDFILLELACILQSCFEARLLDGKLLERLKMDVNV